MNFPHSKSISCPSEKGPSPCCKRKASGLSYFSGTMGNPGKGWLDRLFHLQQPSMIFKTFVEMAQNHSLFIHIGATLKETLLSFLFVVVLGLGISILLWGCPRLAKVLEPYLVVLNSFPSLPWHPFSLYGWVPVSGPSLLQVCLWQSLDQF